jgi:hypothetical protein
VPDIISRTGERTEHLCINPVRPEPMRKVREPHRPNGNPNPICGGWLQQRRSSRESHSRRPARHLTPLAEAKGQVPGSIS